VIHTDHENLTRAYYTGSVTVFHWKMFMQEFSYSIVHVKGETTLLLMPSRVFVQTSCITTPSRKDIIASRSTYSLLSGPPTGNMESHRRYRYFLRGARRTGGSGRATARSDCRSADTFRIIRSAHNHDVGHHGL
jgi:hypothetical protein